MSWETPPPVWDTPAGRLLDAFLAALKKDAPGYSEPLTIFGSAAIQLCLDESFTSADVDVMALAGNERLREIAKTAGLGATGSIRAAYGIQICPPQLFRTTPHYLLRARMERRHGIKVILPHLRDVLLAKLHRSRAPGQEGLVPKDRRAFQRVRELCGGHPTEADIIEDLRLCSQDLLIQAAEEPNAFRLNVLDLFRSVFGRGLDIENEILKPARQALGTVQDVDHEEIQRRLASLRPDRD